MTGVKLRRYHAAGWDEPLIMELGGGASGASRSRGPSPRSGGMGDADVSPRGHAAGGAAEAPGAGAAPRPQALPAPVPGDRRPGRAIDISVGTATMKYSPKVNDRSAPRRSRDPPGAGRGDDAGAPGDRYRFGDVYLTGDHRDGRVRVPAAGGAAGAFTNAAMMRRYHELNGELGQRDEVITTIF